MLAGSALVSVAIARYGDRIGRRRWYRGLFVVMAGAGTVYALTSSVPALILAGLTGTVSTDVVESGPFTSLEQAMLSHAATGPERTRLFGNYNTVATVAGSVGALLALVGTSPKWLLIYPVAAAAGLLASARLSSQVELGQELREKRAPPLQRSRGIVMRMSGLFALDSFGGGFVPQTFIAYLFTRKYGATPQTLAIVFFAIGLLQAFSFQAAVRLAGRYGLLRTMVFSHLPSNLLLAAVAFAPNLATAIALLLGRFTLSQMDVPTRQVYVVAVGRTILVRAKLCTVPTKSVERRSTPSASSRRSSSSAAALVSVMQAAPCGRLIRVTRSLASRVVSSFVLPLPGGATTTQCPSVMNACH